MAAFDKGLLNFLNEWSKVEKNIFLLSEVTAQYRRYTASRVQFPYICTPHLLAKEMILLHMDIETIPEMECLFQEKSYIREAVENLEKRHGELGEGYAKAWSYFAYQYIEKLLDILKPQKVILWNEFYAFHHIFHGICKECEISVGFMEFGCLPGTVVIEETGQQGESLLARNPEEFKRKSVSFHEKRKAGKVIEFLKETGFNRNVQPENIFSKKMINRFQEKRPIVTYMGQNDYESGLFPYTENTKKFHSPIYQTSLEALEYMEGLAIKNNWNLVYKPHPIMSSLGQTGDRKTMEEMGVTVADWVDINSLIDASDVVVTILSQSAYIALIREKPVVMLGYNQLKGKECTYEAFAQEEIEGKIQVALVKGRTKQQKRNFKKHVAQLLKYYLYDDMINRKMNFGKPIAAIKNEEQ